MRPYNRLSKETKRLQRLISNVYLALDAERISHKERMFAFVYSAHDKSWRLVGDAIVIYTNPFSAQQEYINIISPADSITETSLA